MRICLSCHDAIPYTPAHFARAESPGHRASLLRMEIARLVTRTVLIMFMAAFGNSRFGSPADQFPNKFSEHIPLVSTNRADHLADVCLPHAGSPGYP